MPSARSPARPTSAATASAARCTKTPTSPTTDDPAKARSLAIATQLVQDGWEVHERAPKTDSGIRLIALDEETNQGFPVSPRKNPGSITRIYVKGKGTQTDRQGSPDDKLSRKS